MTDNGTRAKARLRKAYVAASSMVFVQTSLPGARQSLATAGLMPSQRDRLEP
jgi:hypothetical protein